MCKKKIHVTNRSARMELYLRGSGLVWGHTSRFDWYNTYDPTWGECTRTTVTYMTQAHHPNIIIEIAVSFFNAKWRWPMSLTEFVQLIVPSVDIKLWVWQHHVLGVSVLRCTCNTKNFYEKFRLMQPSGKVIECWVRRGQCQPYDSGEDKWFQCAMNSVQDITSARQNLSMNLAYGRKT